MSKDFFWYFLKTYREQDMKKATRAMISVSFINTLHLDSKSLYICRAVSTSYGIEIEISAGFRPVGIIEKNGPIITVVIR